MSAVLVTAEWRHLLMLNFEVDPRLLERWVPLGTEVDDWRGTTYVSLVGFRFVDTKVAGFAIPFHRDFDEINLRFYVRSRGSEGWRRGVVFIREVVPRRAIAWIARRLYNENYVACPTRSVVAAPSGGSKGRATYGWRHHRRWLTIGAEYAGDQAHPRKDSEEEFITEHFWGYARQADGGTVEYRVEHPQWRIWPTAAVDLDGDFGTFYGAGFAATLAGKPRSAFVAEGSIVAVRKGIRVNAGSYGAI